jgi:hypothetical protein
MESFDTPVSHNPLKTREDFFEAFRQLTAPLKPYYSEGCAHLHLYNQSAGYSDEIAGMEGFSRVLWGLAPYLAGNGKSSLKEIFLDGIRNGTNPTHSEYWGKIGDRDQRMVEMAAYGFALALTPQNIWEPLNAEEQERFAKWLYQINDYETCDNNWKLFCVLVNIGLQNVGAPYSHDRIESSLKRIEDFYVGGGWYVDGVGKHADYYVAFAIQFYTLLYARLMKDKDPQRAETYKERATLFAKDFIYWFSRDGSALAYGRSLTYRFAQSAFWGAAAFAEITPFPMGVMKGILLRNMRWWFRQPIFNPDGTLPVGYAYPNLLMGENYNSPGSPYWAFKSFLPLAFPKNHSFWQTEELPLPDLSTSKIEPVPHFLLYRQKDTNHVLAFNGGYPNATKHTHSAAKYEKFVYSSVFGFSVQRGETGLATGAFDSTLALSENDGFYRAKFCSEDVEIEEDRLHFKWHPFENVAVETWLFAGAPWHVRVHRISSQRLLNAADGGFALALERSGKPNTVPEICLEERSALAQLPWGVCGAKHLYGEGTVQMVKADSNTNLFSPRTLIPTVTAEISRGTTILVDAFFAEPDFGPFQEEWEKAPFVKLADRQIRLFLDGTTKPVATFAV